MKVGDLIYDYDYGLQGLVLAKEGPFFRILYEDGITDPAADPGKYDVKILAAGDGREIQQSGYSAFWHAQPSSSPERLAANRGVA
jgi:hypothetical protein|tara:strand:+ start:127 stop:381 length:255 start_codon:yes stop_codon:yes gene_type:complete